MSREKNMYLSNELRAVTGPVPKLRANLNIKAFGFPVCPEALKIHLHFHKQIRDTRALNKWKKAGRITGHIGSLVRYLQVARYV